MYQIIDDTNGLRSNDVAHISFNNNVIYRGKVQPDI